MTNADWGEKLRAAGETAGVTRSTECAHPNRQLRKKLTASGDYQFVRQCLVCGSSGQSIPHRDVQDSAAIPDFDRELSPAWFASARMQIATEPTPRWHDVYAEYLRSPEWASRRRLVMQREDYTCEGCRTKRATVVHHDYGYARAGREPLFELRALCRECHAAIHGAGDRDTDD